MKRRIYKKNPNITLIFLIGLILLTIFMQLQFGRMTKAAENTYDMSTLSGDLILEDGGPYIITGSSTKYGIIITATNQIEITLNNVNIDLTNEINKSALDSGNDVIVILEGKNTLKGYSKILNYYMQGQPAIKVEDNDKLEIKNGISLNSSLEAIGGYSGAGIGGGLIKSSGSIVITSGEIKAVGGQGASGIGGGLAGSGGTILINGGIVTALGGVDGASAIGGGGRGTNSGYYSQYGGAGGNITIKNGLITAIGSSGGAGIGGCSEAGGEIIIEGGNIITSGGTYAAGINASKGLLKINGGSISASGGYNAAGIGSGGWCSGGTILITAGTILANGGDSGAGIGNGLLGNGGSVSIEGGNINATGGRLANGIGTGFKGNNVAIHIIDGNITATSVDYGNGIGGYFSNDTSIIIDNGVISATGGKNGGDGIGITSNGGNNSIVFNGGTINTRGGQLYNDSGSGISIGENSSLVINGGNIDTKGSQQGSGISGASATLTINSGKVNATGYGSSGGIQFDNTGIVRIYDGQINSIGSKLGQSGHGGIGIGAGKIEIFGGNVNATGGDFKAGIGNDLMENYDISIFNGLINAVGGKGGSGIGGSSQGTGVVRIIGGTISATGGYGANGIGVGQYASEGIINIEGGIVKAIGGNGGAGIGGGYNTDGCFVKITGGTITAIGGSNGAGIGGSYNIPGSQVIIDGGSIKALGKDGAQNIGTGNNNTDTPLDSGTLTNSFGELISERIINNAIDAENPVNVEYCVPIIEENNYNYCYSGSGHDDNDMNLYFYLPLTLSSDASLKEILISGATLTPSFTSENKDYVVTVANEIESITVTPKMNDSSAMVRLYVGGVETAQPICLSVGITKIIVEVTAEDGITKQNYKIDVTRELSSDASLANLSISRGLLSPSFSTDILNYKTLVMNDIDNIKITPTVSQTDAKIYINGILVESGIESEIINLSVGTNIINIEVTAQDGITKKIYTINITREQKDYSGIYNIQSKKSNLLMDVYNGGKEKGNNVIQWPANGGINQQWKFERLENGYYKITSQLSGMAMDVYNAGASNGNRVIQWPYHGGNNQQWKLIENSDGTITFISRLSVENSTNYALDVFNGGITAGVNVIQWTLHSGDNQRWYLQPVEEHTLKYEVNGGSTIADSNHLPGVLLTEPTTPTKENLVFGGWYKDTELTQRWNFTKDRMPETDLTLYAKWEQDLSGVYNIRSKNSDLVMDVFNGGSDQGVNVIQWTKHGGINQQWKFEALNNGYYKITSMLSGMSIDVYNGGTEIGNRVIQWPYHGGINQQWKIIRNDDGTVSLMSRLAEESGTKFLLDVYGGGKDMGVNVIQWTSHYGDNQKWYIDSVE